MARQALIRNKTADVFASVEDVRARLGDGVPLDATSNPGLTASELTNKLKTGIDEWAGSSYEQAQSHLQAALELAARNPTLVVSDPTLRKLIPRAIVGRAVSLLRLKREAEAKQAIMDLVVVSTSDSILDTWGPEADRIFQLARKDSAARGKGALLVDVDDPTAIFYLNETGEPHRKTFAGEIAAGPVRILVQDSQGKARRYVVVVSPARKTALDVRWARDTQIEVGEERVGFAYRTREARAEEARLAAYVGQHANVQAVAVLGLEVNDGRKRLSGRLYDVASGAPIRTCAAAVPSAKADSADELARCVLATGAATPNVGRKGGAPASSGVSTSYRERQLGPLHALGLGIGAGGIFGLGYSAYLKQSGTDQHATRGFVISGVGVAIGLIAAVAYFRQDEQQPRRAISLIPLRDGGLASVGWAF